MIVFDKQVHFVCDACGAYLEGEGVYLTQTDCAGALVHIAHLGACAERLSSLYCASRQGYLSELVTLLDPKIQAARSLLSAHGYTVDEMNYFRVLATLSKLGYIWQHGWVKSKFLPCIDLEEGSKFLPSIEERLPDDL